MGATGSLPGKARTGGDEEGEADISLVINCNLYKL